MKISSFPSGLKSLMTKYNRKFEKSDSYFEVVLECARTENDI